MKLSILACLAAITLISCNDNGKKAFLDQTIKENQQQKKNTLISYAVDTAFTKDEITTMYYHAKVKNGTTESTIADSLTYAITGDSVYTSQ
jgi:hypothetical protein